MKFCIWDGMNGCSYFQIFKIKTIIKKQTVNLFIVNIFFHSPCYAVDDDVGV